MKAKIISDGLGCRTSISDDETGYLITNITKMDIRIRPDEMVMARVEFVNDRVEYLHGVALNLAGKLKPSQDMINRAARHHNIAELQRLGIGRIH